MGLKMFNKHSCTYCQEELTGLRVKCVTCNEFILCLQCFSNGAEIGPHKNNHPYQFMNTGTLAVVSKSGWTASEELNLLDAIENYGYGNWEDIANHIESRTPDEAKEEYINRFLNGSIGRVMWEPAYSVRPHVTDLTVTDDGPLGPVAMAKLAPLDITSEEATLLGYMPQRDDYEKEYDNTAELLVSSLSINLAEEDELDIALKLAQVDMYMNSLRERMRRKRIVKDYQLVSLFFATRKDRPFKKKQTKEQKEFEDKFRTFCQFMTSYEFDQLLSSLHRERDLRRRLKELTKYRNNGLVNREECIRFNELILSRQNEYKSSADNDYFLQTSHQPPMIRKREKRRNFFSIRKRITSSTEHPLTSQHLINDLHNLNFDPSSIYFNLLSSSEIELCSMNDLYPSRYISLKTVLLMINNNKKLKLEQVHVCSPTTQVNDFPRLFRRVIDLNRLYKCVNDLLGNAFTDEADEKLKITINKDQQETMVQKHKLRELHRQLDHYTQLKEFLSVKGQKRVLADLEQKENAKKQQKIEQIEKYTQKHITILEKIKEFSVERTVERLSTIFLKQEEENFALFNYVNEVNNEVETLQDEVASLSTQLDEQRLISTYSKKEQSESFESFQKELDRKKEMVGNRKEKLSSANEILNSIFTEMENLFTLFKNGSSSLIHLLGENQVSSENAELFLDIMEKKVNDFTLENINN